MVALAEISGVVAVAAPFPFLAFFAAFSAALPAMLALAAAGSKSTDFPFHTPTSFCLRLLHFTMPERLRRHFAFPKPLHGERSVGARAVLRDFLNEWSPSSFFTKIVPYEGIRQAVW